VYKAHSGSYLRISVPAVFMLQDILDLSLSNQNVWMLAAAPRLISFSGIYFSDEWTSRF
jgi:hypothetical protein